MKAAKTDLQDLKASLSDAEELLKDFAQECAILCDRTRTLEVTLAGAMITAPAETLEWRKFCSEAGSRYDSIDTRDNILAFSWGVATELSSRFDRLCPPDKPASVNERDRFGHISVRLQNRFARYEGLSQTRAAVEVSQGFAGSPARDCRLPGFRCQCSWLQRPGASSETWFPCAVLGAILILQYLTVLYDLLNWKHAAAVLTLAAVMHQPIIIARTK